MSLSETATPFVDCTEQKRLNEARETGIPWKKWGPYLSERQWGTVREDYSHDGNAWDYFTHDQSRSRAYRWGEDGLGGISDDKQRLCFALALWNGKDPILKERMFGLTNSEANHGEDVKEYYFYVDSTPTHSYMKYLYKYPQREYPYRDLIETNRGRSRKEFEYELLDTGAFEGDRYFDVFVEYAKEGPEDVLVKVTVHNRGPEAAQIHLLPTLWFRNTWSWGDGEPKPALRAEGGTILASHPELGEMSLSCDGYPELLFTENETNVYRLWGQANPSPYVKDSFHQYVVEREEGRRQPGEDRDEGRGPLRPRRPGGRKLRRPAAPLRDPAGACPSARPSTPPSRARLADADEFYERITPRSLTEDERRVHRQALAGMLWSKQFYFYDVDRWLKEHEAHPLLGAKAREIRNSDWFHMFNGDVISMPDKWEYPWYAAWDLAFHTTALALVDFDFAKEQLLLMLRSLYFHPNGQIPAYEWNFGDVNPPVHAWATLYLYKYERSLGRADRQVPRAGLPGAAAELQLVGEPQGPARDGTSSRAASSASTTSASSTGARSSRPAAPSSRPTGPPGWPSTARTCSTSRSSWPRTTRPTRRSRSSTSSTSPGSPTRWTGSASTTTRCGTRRTASTTTSCGSRTATRRASRSGRWSASSRSAPPRSSRGRPWTGCPS